MVGVWYDAGVLGNTPRRERAVPQEPAEFLFEPCPPGIALELAGTRLQQVLKQPMQIAGVNVSTSASIGITFSSMGYASPTDMVRDADTGSTGSVTVPFSRVSK